MRAFNGNLKSFVSVVFIQKKQAKMLQGNKVSLRI